MIQMFVSSTVLVLERGVMAESTFDHERLDINFFPARPLTAVRSVNTLFRAFSTDDLFVCFRIFSVFCGSKKRIGFSRLRKARKTKNGIGELVVENALAIKRVQLQKI